MAWKNKKLITVFFILMAILVSFVTILVSGIVAVGLVHALYDVEFHQNILSWRLLVVGLGIDIVVGLLTNLFSNIIRD